MKQAKSNIRAGIIVAIICLFFSFSIVCSKSMNVFVKIPGLPGADYVRVEATMNEYTHNTYVKKTGAHKGIHTHEVAYVDFTYNGVFYEHVSVDNCEAKPGSDIHVYIDPNDPTVEAIDGATPVSSIILLLIFLGITAIGVFLIVNGAKKVHLIKNVKRNGNALEATITSMKPTNDKSSCRTFYIICTAGGNTFQSFPLYDTKYDEGDTVTVYVDPSDSSKYYVDCEE